MSNSWSTQASVEKRDPSDDRITFLTAPTSKAKDLELEAQFKSIHSESESLRTDLMFSSADVCRLFSGHLSHSFMHIMIYSLNLFILRFV